MTTRRVRDSSGERSGARAVPLRRRPRDPRDGAVGRNRPVRGAQAGGAPRRDRPSSPTARAGGPSCPDRCRSRSSGSADLRRPEGACALTWCRVRGEAPGRRVDCLGTLSETDYAPALGRARRPSGASPRWLTSCHAVARAGARRPRGAVGHGDEERLRAPSSRTTPSSPLRTPAFDRLRRQRPPAQRRARAVGAGRGVPAPRLRARDRRLVARPRRGSKVHVAVFRWRLDGREGIGGYELMLRTEPPRRGVRDVLICDFGGVLTFADPGGLPRLSGGVRRARSRSREARSVARRRSTASTRCSRSSAARSPRWSLRARIQVHLEDGFDPIRLRNALLRPAPAEPGL